MASVKFVRSVNVAALGLALCVFISACSKPDLHLLDEPSIHWSDLRGQWVVINYWAEWCKPCVEEIPELNHLARDYSSQVKVLGLNFDKVSPELLRQQAERMHIAFPLLQQSPTSIPGLKQPQVLPSTYVYTPDGTLASVLVGPQTGAGLAQAMGLIEAPKSAPEVVSVPQG